MDRCFKIHGYPPHFKGSKDKKVNAAVSLSPSVDSGDNKADSPSISVAQYQQLMEILNKQHPSTSSQNSDHAMLAGKVCLMAENISKTGWLIDSGATDHICSNLSLFHSYKHVAGTSEFIVVPDGRQIPILHIGSVKVNETLVLHDVLHIPSFQYNLLYVQRLCKDLQCSVQFNGHECILQDHLMKGRPILLGKYQGGLSELILVWFPARVFLPSKRIFMCGI